MIVIDNRSVLQVLWIGLGCKYEERIKDFGGGIIVLNIGCGGISRVSKCIKILEPHIKNRYLV